MKNSVEIKDLLDLGRTIAAKLFEGKTYPWEALDGIKSFILELGETLNPEEYDHPEDGVWIAKDAKVFLTQTNQDLFPHLRKMARFLPALHQRGEAAVLHEAVEHALVLRHDDLHELQRLAHHLALLLALLLRAEVCPLTAAVRERVSKVRSPQLSSTSCWVNCRRVKLRMSGSLMIRPEQSAQPFAHDQDRLRRACARLGGRETPDGDFASVLPAFECLPVLLRFWNADEEFPAQLQLLWDRNTCRYLRYETTFYLTGEILRRLREA